LYSDDPSNTVEGNINGYVYELCAEGTSGCLKESDESLEAALADTYCKVIAGGGYATTRIFYYNHSALAIYIPAESLVDIAGYNLLGVRFEFENEFDLSNIKQEFVQKTVTLLLYQVIMQQKFIVVHLA